METIYDTYQQFVLVTGELLNVIPCWIQKYRIYTGTYVPTKKIQKSYEENIFEDVLVNLFFPKIKVVRFPDQAFKLTEIWLESKSLLLSGEVTSF